MVPYNPHIKYYEGDRRGYFKAKVTPKRMQLDLRFMTSVENPNGTGFTQGSWVVEDASPARCRARYRQTDSLRRDINKLSFQVRFESAVAASLQLRHPMLVACSPSERDSRKRCRSGIA